MSDQNKNTLSDKQYAEIVKYDKLISTSARPPPHYNQWGSSGQCKPKTENCSNGDNSVNVSIQPYYTDDNGFNIIYLSPW